jgi:hypothetical protein
MPKKARGQLSAVSGSAPSNHLGRDRMCIAACDDVITAARTDTRVLSADNSTLNA